MATRIMTSASTGVTRRRMLLALVLGSAGSLLAAKARSATGVGDAMVNARDHGARGDGRHDDTAALQASIDALPASGGTVYVPAGTYLVDPVRKVRLRSRMHMKLAAGAVLMAKPNSAPRAYVLLARRVSDIEISGGAIIGDRDSHLGSAGEWGHGIALYGVARARVRDVRISRCWGDGISISSAPSRAGGKRDLPSREVVIERVSSTGNRRQALTIGYCSDVKVRECEFAGSAGTAPESGIDIEPDAVGRAEQILIDACHVHGNRGNGIQVYKRSHDITIRNCVVENNGGHGIFTLDTSRGLIAGNTVRGNGLKGIALRQGTVQYKLRDNRVVDNARGAASVRSEQGMQPER